VAAQSSCVVNITFTPALGGPSSGNLSVVDASGHTQGAQVLGNGTDFTVSSIPSNVAVKAGQAVTFSVSVSAQADFVGIVSLSCQGGPKGSTCTTTPASIPLTLANSFFLPSVTVTTPPTVAAAPAPMRFPPVSYGNYFAFRLSLWLLVALVPSLWCMRRRIAATLAIPRVAAIALLIGLLLLAVSCGGGSSVTTGPPPPPPPPTPTNYSITTTGTSGALTNSTQVTLTVNP
jgi:hypothetical protein